MVGNDTGTLVAGWLYPPPPGNALRLRRGRRCARLMYGTGSAQLP